MERLLTPRYGGRVEFFTLIEGVTGDMLDTQGAFRQLRREYQLERPNLVVVIRDLDALETDRGQLRKRQSYSRRVARQVNNKGLYLLNIYTIEALVAADIAAFNAHYGCGCEIPGDVMLIEKPIELLRAATQHGKPRYLEAHCAELLEKANYDQLLANCRYFRDFDAAFDQQVPAA